jgi:hypothetical protein
MSTYYYYCEICGCVSAQKSHCESHIKTEGHIQKSNVYIQNVISKMDILSLINNFQILLNKPIQDIYQDIINKKSQLHLPKEEIEEKLNKLKNERKSVQVALCHEITQFTYGKTEQTLNQISERYLLNTIGLEEHLIEVIITNNSLPETQQWKVRTKKKFGEIENINVHILSSSKDSDFGNIDQFISKIITAKSKNELPNILIMCFHKKRVTDDLIKLFDTFCGGNYILNFTKIKFYLNFDEPDANLGITSRFLKKYRKYEHIIHGILFITATPYDEFWEMLNENGITQLLNLQKNNISNESYDDYLAGYCSIKSHIHLPLNYDIDNPLDYIKKVFNGKYIVKDEQGNKIDEEYYIDKLKPFIVFAPGHIYTETIGVGSHEEIVDYFTSNNVHVYLSNGKFKGFIDPSGSRQLLTEFNSNYEIDGELRDSLRKWRELNPTKSLAITGYWTIERGVTFNTNGFNFDYAIISKYHTNKLNKLIQLIGRTTGNKKFVNQMKVICPEEIYNTINCIVENSINLRKLNPESYNKADFSGKDSAIPVKVEFLNDECREKIINAITGSKGYKTSLHRLIKEGIDSNHIKLYDKNNLYKFNISERKLKGVRVYMKERIGKNGEITEDKIESRRFEEAHKAFETCKCVSQSCKEDEYNIDFAKDDYINGSFTNNKNIAWITYKH